MHFYFSNLSLEDIKTLSKDNQQPLKYGSKKCKR